MQNKLEVLVGGIVFAIAVTFVVFAGLRTDILGSNKDLYTLSARFYSAQGVRVGTDVRLAGVKVGYVQAMELVPDEFKAEIKLVLNADLLIPDDSALTVASEGLLGGNFLEIMPGGSPFYYEAGDLIQDTQSAVALTNLLMRFVSGGGN